MYNAAGEELRERDHALYRNVLDADFCADLAREAERLAALPLVAPDNLRTETWHNGTDIVISKFDPVVDISDVYLRLAFDSRVVARVEEFLKEPAELFKDKIVFKLPGHPGFGPHIDASWYEPFPMEIVAVMIAIDEADPVSGALEIASGYSPTDDGPREARDLTGAEIPPPDAWRMVPMRPGDMLVFSSRLPHRSGPNRGPSPRRALFLSYNARRYGRRYLDYYRFRADLLLAGMGETVGNFGVPAGLRDQACFRPPVTDPHPGA